jgi:zinc transporter
LLWAVALDGAGRAREIPLSDLDGHLGKTPLWIHMHREWEGAEAWLKAIKAPKAARRDLMSANTRPDALPLGEGLLVNLRGLNQNPGSDPEDMVALRLWVTPTLVLSSRARHVKAIEDVRAQLKHGYGPQDPGGVLAALALSLGDRMQPFLLALSDAIDELDEKDEALLGADTPDQDRDLEEDLHQSRLDIVGLRRYLAPQQAALVRLAGLTHPVLTPAAREHLGIAMASHIRHLEDLDSMRDRAALLRERIQQRAQERMNRAVYRMSVLASVFLPLTFITGLLGVNLGGIPGATTNWAFWILVVALVAVVAGEWMYLRKGDGRFRDR